MTQTHPVRSLGLITLALLAPLLVACGGSDDEPGATFTSSPSESTSEAVPSEPVGETPDCKVAATKWADRAADHVLDAVTTAPAFAETLKLENLDDPISEISALCSGEVISAVGKAMVPLSEANYELSLCGFGTSCDAPSAKKVRRLADEANVLISDARLLII